MTAESAIASIFTAGFLLLFGMGLTYFVPTIIAVLRKNPNVISIFLVNFLFFIILVLTGLGIISAPLLSIFGWTSIGWGVALIWAFHVPHSEKIIIEKNDNSLNNDTSPLKLLQGRYARGEIPESEYQRMKNELES